MSSNLTDKIFQLSAPYNNPYQGEYTKLLFVCSAGLLRSATCATIFSKKGYNTRSCGSSDYALIPLSANLIAWADHIYFVNEQNYLEALDKFKGSEFLTKLKRDSTVLDIPDKYDYMHPTLISSIEEQIKTH